MGSWVCEICWLWRIGTLICDGFVGYDSKGWVWENGGIWRMVEISGFSSWIWFCVSMDWWVSNLEIGVNFVNKKDAGLLILVGVCWVKISEFADLFLGLIVGVCWFLGFQFWWVYVDFWILVGVCWLLFDLSFEFWLFGYKESTGKAKKRKDKKIRINLLKIWRIWTVRTWRTQRWSSNKIMKRKENFILIFNY